MEGLAAASGVIAVVSLADQVVQGCNYIRHVFDSAGTAPDEIRLLTKELGIIENIVRNSPESDESQDAIDFCNEAVTKLRNIVEKYAEVEGAGKYKKWGKRLCMALSNDKIQKHLDRLTAAKTYLQDLHNISAQSSNTAKNHEILHSVEQLTHSHVESTTIMAHVGGKIEELRRISKDTQSVIHELAKRVVSRAQENSLEEDRHILRIERTLRKLFAEHISGVVAKPSSDLPSTEQSMEQPAIHDNPRSDFERRLSEFTDRQYTEEIAEKDSGDTIDMDKASKYKTWLGEVYMRTVVTTYTSYNDMTSSTLSWYNSMLSKPTNFPITMTKTEVLLIPRTWRPHRAAKISCHQISGMPSEVSDISFDIHNLKVAYPLSNLNQQYDGSAADSFSCREKNSLHLEENLKTSSQSLLYTAFKAAYIAAKTFNEVKGTMTKRLVTKTLIPRNSFDHEIDEIMELVQLWINTDFEADLYRYAFPDDTTQTAKQSASLFRIGNQTHQSFDKLRHEYVFDLVVKMAALRHEGVPVDRDDLDPIHEYHWQQCQLLALASTLNIIMQQSLTFEVSWFSPVFLAARSGNIVKLREIFDSRLASPFDRTIGNINLLESVFICAVRILVCWMFDIFPFKDTTRKHYGKGRNVWNPVHIKYNRTRPPEEQLKSLFDTIDFLFSQNLRLFQNINGVQNHCICLINGDERIMLPPNWTKWLWKGRYKLPLSSCFSNYSLIANFVALGYHLTSACAHLNGHDLDNEYIEVEVERKRSHTGFVWLPDNAADTYVGYMLKCSSETCLMEIIE